MLNDLLGQAALGAGHGQALGSFESYAPTISNKDYKDQKVKYSKFKKCENPIKQSEFTYRG